MKGLTSHFCEDLNHFLEDRNDYIIMLGMRESCSFLRNWATTKKRYSDTTIQRYRNLEPEPGTVHNLCKLEHFAPQEIYMIIIYRGGGAIQR
jgi:hypothetical protein